MGVPKLKAKAERRYRRGHTWRECSDCRHFVPDWAATGEGRCRVMGLEPGRLYRILPHYICDDFVFAKNPGAVMLEVEE